MRRLGTACLLLGLTAPALAADPPPAAEEPSVPWYRRLFLGERSKPTPPVREQPPAVQAGRDRSTPGISPRDTAKEEAARQFNLEKQVYVQRLLAISKIRKLADEQYDEAMLQRADELEQQATEIFNQRTARLTARGDDRATLERGRDDRPATADRTPPRRRTTGGIDR